VEAVDESDPAQLRHVAKGDTNGIVGLDATRDGGWGRSIGSRSRRIRQKARCIEDPAEKGRYALNVRRAIGAQPLLCEESEGKRYSTESQRSDEKKQETDPAAQHVFQFRLGCFGELHSEGGQ